MLWQIWGEAGPGHCGARLPGDPSRAGTAGLCFPLHLPAPPPPSAPRMTFRSKSRPWGPGRRGSPLAPFIPTGSAWGPRGQRQTHLVPDLLAQVLGLVQGEAGHQLRGQHEGAAQLVHDLGHVEEGVVLQQLPGRGGTSHPGPRSPPAPHPRDDAQRRGAKPSAVSCFMLARTQLRPQAPTAATCPAE